MGFPEKLPPGRLGLERMPAGALGLPLVGMGANADPAYSSVYKPARTATYVVAASDAPAHVKAQADFVCDGIADNVEIQAAIDAIPAGFAPDFSGGVLRLSEGTFSISSQIDLPEKYLTIQGAGMGATRLELDANINCMFNADTFTWGALRDLSLDGNNAIRTSGTAWRGRPHHFEFYRVSFDAWKDTGIHFRNVGIADVSTFIVECVFQNIQGNAIHNEIGVPTNELTIRDSWFYNNEIGYYGRGQRINIINNVFANHLYKDISIWNDSQYIKILGNQFEGANQWPIEIYSGASTMYSVQILHNTFCNNVVSTEPLITATATGVGSLRQVLIKDNIVYSDPGCQHTRFVECNQVNDLQIEGNDLSQATFISTPIIYHSADVHSIKNNLGYISQGEIRTASGSLTAGNANAICFAWHNPEAQDILIKKVVIEVTTGGGTPGAHLDVGIADDATGTNRGTEFFDDLDLDAVAIRDSWLVGDGGQQTKYVFCQDSVSATDGWIVGQILTQNAASLVGKYYIEYAGR